MLARPAIAVVVRTSTITLVAAAIGFILISAFERPSIAGPSPCGRGCSAQTCVIDSAGQGYAYEDPCRGVWQTDFSNTNTPSGSTINHYGDSSATAVWTTNSSWTELTVGGCDYSGTFPYTETCYTVCNSNGN